MKRATLATLVAVVVCFGVTGSTFAQATAPPPAQGAPAGQTAPKKKFVAPVKGVAEIGYLKPVVKVDTKTNEVVTTIKIKNMSLGSIAGLRVDEFWYDKGGNMLPGDSERLRQPLNPGEVATIELRTPKNPKMDRNSWQFSHANGTIKTKQLTKLE